MEKKSIFTREYRVLLQLLHDARERAGVTQVELAERLGRSQSFVSKCERGETRIDLVQLHEICRILKKPLVDFVRDYEKRLSARQA
jgi:transcriptional regulator with XRE-family HTH domain